MVQQKKINFNGNDYTYNYYVNDDSGLGSIIEMITNGEYGLERFTNIDNKTILDIGGNHGLATVILAKQNPKSTVYTFEPNPKIYKVLESNVEINGLTNVKLFNKALHTKKGLKLMEHPRCSGASILSNEKESMDSFYKRRAIYGSSDVVEIEIESISIDEFLIDEKINKIYLLKIDCEGSEFDILMNSKLLFKDVVVDNIIGEFHDLSYNINPVEINSEGLLEICKKNIKGINDIKILKL
jgi:FkbM family methyltransferase